MAGLVPAISLQRAVPMRSGCPRHGRANGRRSSNGYGRAWRRWLLLAFI